MKVSNGNWFDKLFFPGAEVLYPLLSLLCLFFYFAFFGRYTDSVALKGESVPWLGYYLAILGYVFFSLWGMTQKWWHLRFLVIGTMIISFSFVSFHQKSTFIPPYLELAWLTLLCFAIFIFIYCFKKFLKSELKGKILWSLPVIVISVYYLVGNVFITMVCSIITIITLVILDTDINNKYFKVITAIGVGVFYIASVCTDIPYNPILSFRNIKSVFISLNPRVTNLVVEQDGKFMVVDGSSLKGRSPITHKFDCWQQIKDFPNPVVMGFKSDRYKKFESASFYKIKDKDEFFPFYVSDSCVYFTPEVKIYDCLDDYKRLDNEIQRLTSMILTDFMDSYQCDNDTTMENLKKHQHALQEVLNKFPEDSLKFSSISKTDSLNPESVFMEFSKKLSIGTLNALCGDLVLNNDINSALKIFCYQFFMTFFDTPIYDRVINNFNVRINSDFGDQVVFEVADKDLSKTDTFDHWLKMLSMSIAFAKKYLYEIQAKKIASLDLSNLEEKTQTLSQTIVDSDKIVAVKEEMDKIQSSIGDYSSTPMLNQYATIAQDFLYQCVLRNYLPDYNSFFINRFNDFTPMVPMNPKSVTAYNNMKELYSGRFDKGMKTTEELRKLFDETKLNLDTLISFQKSMENLGLSPEVKNMLNKFLLGSIKSEK